MSSAPARTRVLIADDNQDSALRLAWLVAQKGHTVFTAFSGGQAIEVADREHPDVLILDITMPEMSGLEVARRIREKSWGREVKLIALSGFGRRQDLYAANVAGFDHHLLKPMDVEHLLRLFEKNV